MTGGAERDNAGQDPSKEKGVKSRLYSPAAGQTERSLAAPFSHPGTVPSINEAPVIDPKQPKRARIIPAVNAVDPAAADNAGKTKDPTEAAPIFAAVDAESPRERETHLREILAGLDTGETSNPYLTDAKKFAEQIIENATIQSVDSPERKRTIDSVLNIFGNHAVTTGNSELAQRVFELLSPADRWLLYATAYTADKLDKTQLDDWATALHTREETWQTSQNPFFKAARFLALSEIELHNYLSDDRKLEEKQDAHERAVAYKDAFNDTLRSFFDEHIALPYGDQRTFLSDKYVRRLRTSFVKAGLWREVESFSSTAYENSEAKMVGIALTGGYSENDLKKFAYRGRSAGPLFIWISNKKNGIDSEIPKIEELSLSHPTLVLLETLAPDLLGQVDGWNATSSVGVIKMQLATGNDSAAKETYTTAYATPSDVQFPNNKLEAALLMAQDYAEKAAKEKAITTREQQVHEALALLNHEGRPNAYLTDAVHFASQLLEDAKVLAANDPEFQPDFRQTAIEKVSFVLANHAVTTHNIPLAEKVYELLSPADKWLVYAKAYEAGFNGEKLAEWRQQLDHSAEIQTPNAKTIAAQHVALIQVELLNAQIPKNRVASLIKARAHKDAFQALINASFIKDSKQNMTNLSNADIAAYYQLLKIAYAKAGRWREVGDLVKDGEQKDRTSQLTAQALASELDNKSILMARAVPNDTVEVLQWVNNRINLKNVAPPKRAVQLPESVRMMLGTLAPELVKELTTHDRDWFRRLNVAVANDDFIKAYREYMWHTGLVNQDTHSLEAALLMSQHQIVITESSRLHDVHYDAFKHHIAPIEETIAEYLNPDTYFDLKEIDLQEQLKEWYNKLVGGDPGEKLHELLTPQQLLLAKARLARLYAKVTPNGGEYDELGILMRNIRQSWDTLEQHENSREKLPEIVKEMQEMGYTFIKRWKSHAHQSYVGYDPVLVSEEHKELSRTIDERDLTLYRDTAWALNELHGEERYRIQPTKERSWGDHMEILVKVLIQGACQTYEINNNGRIELDDAVDYLRQSGHQLAPSEASVKFTQRLDAIMTPLLAEKPVEENTDARTEKISETDVETEALEPEIPYETLIARSPSLGPLMAGPDTFGAHSNNLAEAVSTNDLFTRSEHGIRESFLSREEMLAELATENLSEFGHALKEIITARIVIDIGCGRPDLSQTPLLLAQAFAASEYHGIDQQMPKDVQQIVDSLGVKDIQFNYRQDDALHFLSQLSAGNGFVFHLSGIESFTPDEPTTRAYINALLKEMQRVTKPGDAIIIGFGTKGFDPEKYGFELKHTHTKKDGFGDDFDDQRVYVKQPETEKQTRDRKL